MFLATIESPVKLSMVTRLIVLLLTLVYIYKNQYHWCSEPFHFHSITSYYFCHVHLNQNLRTLCFIMAQITVPEVLKTVTQHYDNLCRNLMSERAKYPPQLGRVQIRICSVLINYFPNAIPKMFQKSNKSTHVSM